MFEPRFGKHNQRVWAFAKKLIYFYLILFKNYVIVFLSVLVLGRLFLNFSLFNLYTLGFGSWALYC